MAGERISVGGIEADIVIDTGNLDGTLKKVQDGLTRVDAAIAALQAQMGKAGGYSQELESQLDHLIVTKQGLTEAARQLTASIGESSAAKKVDAAAAKAMAQANREATQAAERLAQRVSGLSLSAVSASRAFQDVAQSGPAAALNNLEYITYGLARAFGASATQGMMAGAAVQLLATAALVAYENWDKLTEAFGESIPAPTLDGLKAMEEALKRVQHELDETRKKGRLGSLIELNNDEANQKLAKALKGATKEQEAVDDLEGPSREEAARGRAFVDAIREQGHERVQSALRTEYEGRAAEEGQTLDRAEIEKMLKDQGVLGKIDSRYWGQSIAEAVGMHDNRVDRNQLKAMGEMLGVDFDADKLDAGLAKGGSTFDQLLIDQLEGQRFLWDEQTGAMLTPEAMSRRRLAQGASGNKDVAGEVGNILDRRLGNPAEFESSVFSKEFGENSPEGKAAAKEAKDQVEANAKSQKKKADDAKKKEASREKGIGRLAYLQEESFYGLTKDEENELNRLEEADVKRRTREAEHDQREKIQKRKQNERDAREATPGIDTQSELLAMQVMAGALTPGDAKSMIEKHLRANGVDPTKSVDASDDIYDDAQRKVREGVIKRALDGKEKNEFSQVFDASSVAARFQSSVGDSEQKKQTGILEEMRKSLDEMAKAGVLNVRIKKS